MIDFRFHCNDEGLWFRGVEELTDKGWEEGVHYDIDMSTDIYVLTFKSKEFYDYFMTNCANYYCTDESLW